MARKELGQYVVVDSEICHGKPTFTGTRIMVWQVLEMVAEGVDWDRIVWECHDSITKEAIAEAVLLASNALAARAQDDAALTVPAA